MSTEVKKYDNNGKELAIRFGLAGIKAVGAGMVEEMVKNRQKNGGSFKNIYDFADKAGQKAMNKKAIEALAKSGAFDSIHNNRNQIVESVEIICKYAASREEERNSDQMSLFGSAQISDEKPLLKKSNDWNKETKLQEEFKAFGFFLKEHPIDDFLDDLGRRGVISSEILEEINDNSIIKLAGVVAYSKHKSGPKGRYAYLTLSDPFGIYETSIFDEALITAHRDEMTDGSSLVVECLVKKDQGGARFLVKSIERMDVFIKRTTPKKEIYQDIRQQERRTEFDWKKRAEKTDPKNDSVVRDMEYQRKISLLASKKIINEVPIKISDRRSILQLKSFLSQRIAPASFESYSRICFLIEDGQGEHSKIDLPGKYLIDEADLAKINNLITSQL
ncbi:MAG: dnaE1 [Rickettsiaceae bacterium]|jgi:DNA polymerase III alpha subunit|nr:dnaE1 [Rickettsiaceae bacterium]